MELGIDPWAPVSFPLAHMLCLLTLWVIWLHGAPKNNIKREGTSKQFVCSLSENAFHTTSRIPASNEFLFYGSPTANGVSARMRCKTIRWGELRDITRPDQAFIRAVSVCPQNLSTTVLFSAVSYTTGSYLCVLLVMQLQSACCTYRLFNKVVPMRDRVSAYIFPRD